MASVRKLYPNDPKSKWVVEYTDAAGKRRRKTPNTGLKKDAERIKQQIERDLGDDVHMAKSESATMAEVVDEWMKDVDLRARIGDRMTLNTAYCYKGYVGKHIKPDLGRLVIVDITPQYLSDYLRKKRDGLHRRQSNTSIRC